MTKNYPERTDSHQVSAAIKRRKQETHTVQIRRVKQTHENERSIHYVGDERLAAECFFPTRHRFRFISDRPREPLKRRWR